MALEDSQVVNVKFAAVEGAIGDWALYVGWGDWSDDRVKAEGHKVSYTLARELRGMDLLDSRWGALDYRP